MGSAEEEWSREREDGSVGGAERELERSRTDGMAPRPRQFLRRVEAALSALSVTDDTRGTERVSETVAHRHDMTMRGDREEADEVLAPGHG
jgi:hypothetical protein